MSTHTVTQADLDAFAEISGDDNPIHVDPQFAAATPFRVPVAHGMFLFSLVRGQLQRRWPRSRLVEQRLMFPAPTPVGSVVTITLDPVAEEGRHLRVAVQVSSDDGSAGLQGEAILELRGQDE